MLELSNVIFAGLSGDTNVTGLVGNKIFPLIADQEVERPYIVYSVEKNEPLTKDGANDYTVEIVCYENNYEDALKLHNYIIEAMQQVNYANTNYYFKDNGASADLTEDYGIKVKQILNIKK